MFAWASCSSFQFPVGLFEKKAWDSSGKAPQSGSLAAHSLKRSLLFPGPGRPRAGGDPSPRQGLRTLRRSLSSLPGMQTPGRAQDALLSSGVSNASPTPPRGPSRGGVGPSRSPLPSRPPVVAPGAAGKGRGEGGAGPFFPPSGRARPRAPKCWLASEALAGGAGCRPAAG